MEDRQPEPTVIRPAWKRVMDLPELGDMLALHFSRRDLASCCLVSSSFHSLWSLRLWRVIEHIPRTAAFPISFEHHGHLVSEWHNIVLRFRKHRDALDSGRLNCRQLRVLELRLIEFRWQSFLVHFMGLGEEEVKAIDSISTEEEPFIPGRHTFVDSILYDSDNNTNSDSNDKLWYHRLIPSPQQSPNAFLSNTLQTLRIAIQCRDEGVIIPWLTRAALEGRGDHLQGLEIFQLGDIPKGLYTGGDPLGLNWEVFYQFLESLPRLREFSALQLKIAPDVLPNGPDILRINADILDNDSAHSTQATARRSQTLGLIKLALHSTTPNPRLETDQDGTGDQKDLAGLLARVPRLVQLQFQDVVVLDLITALNLRDERDNKYNSVVMSIREFGLNKYTRPPITLDPIVMKDWRNLVSSPMFRLETLDLLSREDVPGDLLDHITSSPSISTLRCVLMNRTIPQPAHRELTVYYQSIRQFLRSAPSLVEFMAPYTTFDAPEEFFTPQESARWPCRDTLKILKLHSVDLQESTQYSGELRRWLWSFKRLEEAEILGRGATVDVLIDPTFARPTSQELTALPLVMNRLQLPDILSTRITLAQVKDVVERVIPNLFYLEVGTYEPDAEAWLSEYHPDIHSYMSEMLFA